MPDRGAPESDLSFWWFHSASIVHNLSLSLVKAWAGYQNEEEGGVSIGSTGLCLGPDYADRLQRLDRAIATQSGSVSVKALQRLDKGPVLVHYLELGDFWQIDRT